LVRSTPFSSYDLATATTGATIYNTTTGNVTLGGTGRFIRVYRIGTGDLTISEAVITGMANANTNPFNYSWNAGGIGNVSNPTCLSAGTYQVTITDQATGCEVIQSIVIN